MFRTSGDVVARFDGGRPDPYRSADTVQRVTRLRRTTAVAATGGAELTAGVTAVVLTLNRPEYLLPLLDQLEVEAKLLADAGLGFQLLIGDTGSSDPAVLRRYRHLPDYARVVTGMRYQFARCNNQLAGDLVRHDHLLLLNNDVSFAAAPGAIAALVAGLTPGVGAVGLALDFPDGTIQHVGVDVVRSGPLTGLPVHEGTGQPARHEPGRSWSAPAVTGACLMLPTLLWRRLGGLDETFDTECQDIDLCLRLRRLGYDVRVVDAGPVVHIENGTRRDRDAHRDDRELFLRRWRSFIEAAL